MTSTPRSALANTRVLPTVADTEALGAEIAGIVTAGDVIVADGPLGAGKTAFARGVGAGLAVTGAITSPTFIIAREHRPSGPNGVGLVHVDAYRLGTHGDVAADLDALDLDTDLTRSVVLVEWGSGIAEVLTRRYLLVQLRREPDSDVRTAAWGWIEQR